MSLCSFRATDFRCLAEVSAEFDGRANLITGPNAAGKTSVLEAIAYLGRGKSFRGAETERLVRHGQPEFVVSGEVRWNRQTHKIGVRNGRNGLETSVDGDSSGGAAALAETLPLQVIDPDVHNLVAGGPGERRRFLDWIGFHVEQGYLGAWRRYRKGLRQRNAALKNGAVGLGSWDREVAETGARLGEQQRAVFEQSVEALEGNVARLLPAGVRLRFRSGWREGLTLAEALSESRDRDLSAGSTQCGPHRMELVLEYDERRARKLVSRGQQKLLAAGLVLGGVAVVQGSIGRPLLLLVDDPAAELDSASLGRLMAATRELECQVIATALGDDDRLFEQEPRRFTVEDGVLAPA